MSGYHFSLETARQYAGMTQQEAADRLHVHRSTIINWERGKTIPRVNNIEDMAELYGVKQDDIFLPCYSTKNREEES